MAALDKNKPYSAVFNDDLGRKFEQGGAYFTADGKRWDDPAAPAEISPAKQALKKGKAAVQEPTADDQVAAQMGDPA